MGGTSPCTVMRTTEVHMGDPCIARDRLSGQRPPQPDNSPSVSQNATNKELKSTKSEPSLGLRAPRKDGLLTPLRRSWGAENQGKFVESGRQRGGTPLCSPSLCSPHMGPSLCSPRLHEIRQHATLAAAS